MTASSITAIFKKEFRENLQWAAISFAITLLLLSYALYTQFNSGVSITGDLFSHIYLVLCPVAGIVLGLVQMTPDMRRGRWQFLNHRPLSPGSWFLGKIFAGAVLYFLSVGLPLALIVVWVATPGHFPGPFSSNMIGPNADRFFAGFPWYAAGLLIAARGGRWVGSRLIPIGGAVAAILFCHEFPGTVMESVVASIIFTVIILTPARGAFITGGEMSRSSAFAKACLAFTLIAGWAFVIVIAALLAQAEAGPRFWSWSLPMAAPQSGQTIGLDGGVWLNIWPSQNSSGLLITDRQWPSTSSEKLWMNPTTIQSATLAPAPKNQFPMREWVEFNTGIRSPKLTRLFASLNGNNWFYVWQRQTVEGYDRKTCKFIGSLGPFGFRGPSASPEPFPEPFASLNADSNAANLGLFQWPNVVYRLTASPPDVRTAFTASPADPIISSDLFIKGLVNTNDLDNPHNYIAVRTRDEVHILQGAHEVITLPVDARSASSDIAVAVTDSGRFIFAFLWQSRGNTTVVENIFFYNADSVLQHQTRYYNVEALDEQSIPTNTNWLEICGFTAFSPLPLIWVVQFHQLRQDAAPWWVMMICSISLFSGAAFAFIAASLLRARHASRWVIYLWMALCALLGLAAILALFSIEERPRATPCPACGKRRLLTELTCPHCGAPATAPEMRGIEILEPALLTN